MGGWAARTCSKRHNRASVERRLVLVRKPPRTIGSTSAPTRWACVRVTHRPLRCAKGRGVLVDRQNPADVASVQMQKAMNVAGRMGRWSAGHWKTAVFGWLALVAASVYIGGAVGTKYLEDSDLAVGEA